MKKILITLSLLIISFTSYSQEQLQPLKYYKVAFHIVRTSAGTIRREGLEIDIQKAIKYMNDKFIGANIQFYTCDINYIDNDTLYDFDHDNTKILTQPYNHDNVVNVYLCNTINGDFYPNGIWGIASPRMVKIRQHLMNELVVITHEFGLVFGMRHTHDGEHEYVDRSNCNSAGDFLCDTPADPGLQLDVDVDENCDYIGGAVDEKGVEYDPDETLIMSHARHSCRTRFSNQQLSVANIRANEPDMIALSYSQIFEDIIITSNQNVEEDVILIKNTKINNNAEVRLKPCAFVEISGDSEVKLGSTLDIRIE